MRATEVRKGNEQWFDAEVTFVRSETYTIFVQSSTNRVGAVFSKLCCCLSKCLFKEKLHTSSGGRMCCGRCSGDVSGHSTGTAAVLYTVIQQLDLLHVCVTESNSLTNGHSRLLGLNGHLGAVNSEGVGAVVHDTAIVVGLAQHVDVTHWVFVKVTLMTCHRKQKLSDNLVNGH